MIKAILKNAFAKQKPAYPYPSVSLFNWKPKDGTLNFGDELSEVVTTLMLASQGRTLLDEVREEKRLFTIGSILHFADNDAVVWGSGINGKIDPALHRFERLDVRAVRGPRTYERLKARGISCPDVFGDPALLLPSFCSPQSAQALHDAIFIPNLNDLKAISGLVMEPSITLVSPLLSWNRVLQHIVSSKLVLSSSLHGVILAESFGVPCRYVRISEVENMFKFLDYFEGTGRFDLEYATCLSEGLEMGGANNLFYDATKLKEAFPFDIWESRLEL